MRTLLLAWSILLPSLSHAAIPVKLVPQLHRPVGATWTRVDPLSREVVVRAQVDILNYFFERRAGHVVVFAEANHKHYAATGQAVPLIAKETVAKVREDFSNLTFPIQADQLSERQRYILFTASAPSVALSFGWVDEMPATESLLSQGKTVYLVVRDSAKFLYRLFFRRRNDSDQTEGMLRQVLMPDAIFELRERDVLKRVVAYAKSPAAKSNTELTLVFGMHHEFPQGNEFDVQIERVPSRIPELLEQISTEAAAAAMARFESCEDFFGTPPPENAGVIRMMWWAYKQNKKLRAAAKD